MERISQQSSVQVTQNRTRTVEETESATGSGITGVAGDTPDVPTSQLGGLMSALASFLPKTSDDFEARLAEITAKMKETQGETETKRLETDQAMKAANLEENKQKLDEAQTKLEDAEAKGKAAEIWGIIGKVLQAIAAVAMLVVGAVLIATGAGAGLGAALMVSGGLMAFALVDSLVMDANDGRGIVASAVGAAVEAGGGEMSDEAVMALNIGTAVAVAIAGIVAGIVTGGASVSSSFAHMANVIKATTTGIEAASGIASAVTTTGQTAYNMSAAEDKKQAAEITADKDELAALSTSLDDLIDQALEMLMQSSNRFNTMIDEVVGMMKETGDVMSRTRFAV